MCGFVGVVHVPDGTAFGRSVDENVLRKMMSAIAHRGPDSNGVWRQGSVGLGHVRLSILDLSANGHQPFVTGDEQGVLVYNGEVYNFRELRRQLESEGIRFRSTSDSEVVLQAVHHWGPQAAVPKFNGMFAFAYLDRRTEELWLGRDRLGIKPLYWSNSGGVFVFGSEIKALLQHPNVPCRPDMHALTAYLLTASVEGEWTTFEGIRSLRAGTLARLTGSQLSEFVYYDLLDRLSPSGFSPPL
jgi:asparagine synthase (glutamine-hydrolysing)